MQILILNSDSYSMVCRRCDQQSPRRCTPLERTRPQVPTGSREEGVDAARAGFSVGLPILDDRRRRAVQSDAADHDCGDPGASARCLSGMAGLWGWEPTGVDSGDKGISRFGFLTGLEKQRPGAAMLHRRALDFLHPITRRRAPTHHSRAVPAPTPDAKFRLPSVASLLSPSKSRFRAAACPAYVAPALVGMRLLCRRA